MKTTPTCSEFPSRRSPAKKPLAFVGSYADVRRRFSMKKLGFILVVLLLLLGAAAPQAAAKPTIVIDAGHGGHDRGGVPGQKYAEKIYTLDVARRVQARLKNAGYR